MEKQSKMTEIIFIHGILQRSGTNLLNQILLLNPTSIEPVLKIRENWFLHYSDSLYAYADRLFQIWSDPQWGGGNYSKADFYSTIGEALITYISKELPDLSGKALLSKTPSVQHLTRNFQMFPSSKVLIIIRDPRDVAASAFKSWGRPVKQSIYNWNVAAKSIVEFERHTPPDRYFLLRYEDLISNRAEWVRKCIKFLGFVEEAYPWHALDHLPIFGSSEEGKNWQVKSTSPSFRSIGRWKKLSSQQIHYLSNMESSFLDYFGYTNKEELNPLPTYEDRLQKGVLLANSISSSTLFKNNFLGRVSKIGAGLGLIAEAIFGDVTTNYLRSKIIKKES